VKHGKRCTLSATDRIIAVFETRELPQGTPFVVFSERLTTDVRSWSIANIGPRWRLVRSSRTADIRREDRHVGWCRSEHCIRLGDFVSPGGAFVVYDPVIVSGEIQALGNCHGKKKS
jgi:hypothetical protein